MTNLPYANLAPKSHKKYRGISSAKYGIALFLLSALGFQNATAENLLQHNGLEVSLTEPFRCGRSPQVTINAQDPRKLFEGGNLAEALSKTKTHFSSSCPNLTMVGYRATSGNYFLGEGHIHRSSNWAWVPRRHDNLDLFDSQSDPTPSRPPSRAMQRMRSAGMHVDSVEQKSHPFYFMHDGPHAAASLAGKVSGGSDDYTYTEMSKYLAGKHYLFYPYKSQELTTSQPSEMPDPSDRDFQLSLSIDRNYPTLNDGQSSYTGSYDIVGSSNYKTGADHAKPDYQCIKFSGFQTDDCFLILRYYRADGALSGSHLGRVFSEPFPGSPQMKTMHILGYLKEVSKPELTARWANKSAAEKAKTKANQIATTAGRPKPNFEFEYIPAGLEQQLMNEVYQGTMAPPNTRSQSTTQQSLFLAYHQAYSRDFH